MDTPRCYHIVRGLEARVDSGQRGEGQIQDGVLLGGHDFSTKLAAQCCEAPLKRLCETTVPHDGRLGKGGVGLLLLAPSCLQPSIGQNLSRGIATAFYQNEHPGAHRPTSRAASTIAPATWCEMMLSKIIQSVRPMTSVSLPSLGLTQCPALSWE